MKKLFSLIFSLISFVSISQINTIKVVENNMVTSLKKYDSLSNFLGSDVKLYIGQDLYLNGMHITSREYGYANFLIDYTKPKNTLNIKNKPHKTNIYECCDGYNSKYESLVGKYFKVIDVIPHERQSESLFSDNWYLKLLDKSNNKVVYFEYRGKFEHSFPFITVGYYEKLNKTQIGRIFILRGRSWGSMTNINNGTNTTNFKPASMWECVGITIDEKYYNLSLILEHKESGDKILMGIETSNKDEYSWTIEKTDYYITKYGTNNVAKMMVGEVEIGWTKDMCRISIGHPEKINKTTTRNIISEQWVYKYKYLYFTNGILEAIQ